MTPLPKWVSVVSTIVAVATAVSSVEGALPKTYAAIVMAICAALNAFTHALTGTGGSTPPTS